MLQYRFPHQPQMQKVLKEESLSQFSRGASWRLNLLHVDRYDLIIWVTRGSGVATIAGERRGVGAHNLLFIPAGTLYSLELGRQGLATIITVQEGETYGFDRDPMHLPVRALQDQNELSALLCAIRHEQCTGELLQDKALEAYASLIAIWLKRQASCLSKSDDPSPSKRLVMAYSNLLVKQLCSSANLSELAEFLDVTPTHLTRCCNQYCGLSASAMRTQTLLHAARSMIETSDIPLMRIATNLGFGSAEYFSRFITQHTGSAPSVLRDHPQITM